MPGVGLVGLAGNLLSVAVLSGQVGKLKSCEDTQEQDPGNLQFFSEAKFCNW